MKAIKETQGMSKIVGGEDLARLRRIESALKAAAATGCVDHSDPQLICSVVDGKTSPRKFTVEDYCRSCSAKKILDEAAE